MPSRRELISITVAAPVAAQHSHPSGAASESGTYQPKVFTPEELKLVAQLADQIIPRTDTPGAADAGVQLLIDRALSTRPADAKRFRTGMKPFAALNLDRQSARLKSLAAKKDPFFKLLKDLTIDGYYSTREGLVQELGWHGLTPMPEFHGCTHPEHKG